MKSKKKLAIIGGAALAVVTAAVLVAGGNLGALGGGLVDRTVGLFAYSNRSDQPDVEAGEARTPASAAVVAAGPESTDDLTGESDATETDGDPMKSGLAAMTGQFPIAVIDVVGDAVTDEAVHRAEVINELTDAMTDDAAMIAAADLPIVGPQGRPTPLDEESDKLSAVAAGIPLSTRDAPGSPEPEALEESLAGGDEWVETPSLEDEVAATDDEDLWDDSDPFQFEDEGIIREMGPRYSSFGNRDPFFALVTTGNQDVASSELIDPDRLRLVGIVWGDHGIAALVEDDVKRGFVLREGDRVLYGRVASITRDTLIINQVIYGEFKRVKLRLERNREGN